MELIKPEQFATACKKLISYFNNLKYKNLKDLKHKYRLELVFLQTDQTWRLRIKLDAVAWYDYLKTEKYEQSNSDLVSIARDYIDQSRSDLRRVPTEDPCIDYKLFEPAKYCMNPQHRLHDDKDSKKCSTCHLKRARVCDSPMP